jgi:hypothetical protein
MIIYKSTKTRNMEESYFKKYFNGLFSLKKIGVNVLGGLALGISLYVMPILEGNMNSNQLDASNFVLGFIIGFIHINFIVKEARTIAFNDMWKFFLPLGIIAMLGYTLLGN